MSDQGQGHYSTVVRSMAEGRVVPLLGAGVNLASRPRGKAWKQGQYLPNGYELAKYLAGKLQAELRDRHRFTPDVIRMEVEESFGQVARYEWRK